MLEHGQGNKSNSIFKSFKDEDIAKWYMNNFIPQSREYEK